MNEYLNIEIVYALPENYWRVSIQVRAGSTVRDALVLAALEVSMPDADWDEKRLAIFGVAAHMETLLHDGDRIELLRPLQIDPKEARRKRAESGSEEV
jgi:uncharacterized protein